MLSLSAPLYICRDETWPSFCAVLRENSVTQVKLLERYYKRKLPHFIIIAALIMNLINKIYNYVIEKNAFVVLQKYSIITLIIMYFSL